jgi:hypothetical protein
VSNLVGSGCRVFVDQPRCLCCFLFSLFVPFFFSFSFILLFFFLLFCSPFLLLLVIVCRSENETEVVKIELSTLDPKISAHVLTDWICQRLHVSSHTLRARVKRVVTGHRNTPRGVVSLTD